MMTGYVDIYLLVCFSILVFSVWMLAKDLRPKAPKKLAGEPEGYRPMDAFQCIATVRAFEREGLGPALREGQKIIDGPGRLKHGDRNWRDLRPEEIRKKARRHLTEEYWLDPETGKPGSINAMIRCCQCVVLDLETMATVDRCARRAGPRLLKKSQPDGTA